jgi:hypothetical protein
LNTVFGIAAGFSNRFLSVALQPPDMFWRWGFHDLDQRIVSGIGRKGQLPDSDLRNHLSRTF